MRILRSVREAITPGLLGLLTVGAGTLAAQEPKPPTPAANPVELQLRSERETRTGLSSGLDSPFTGIRFLTADQGGRVTLQQLSDLSGDPTGASLALADVTLRDQLEISAGQGLVVVSIAEESQAQKAGLQPKDILLTFDGKPLAQVDDLAKAWKASEKGAALKLIRAGKPLSLELPAGRASDPGLNEFWIGIPVGKVDEVLRSHLDLPEGTGVVLTGVLPDSPASKAGLKTSDILVAFDGKPVPDAKTLRSLIRSGEGKAVALALVRAGKKLTIEVTPERRKTPLSQLGIQIHPPGAFETTRRFQFFGPGVVVPPGEPGMPQPGTPPGLRWRLPPGDPSSKRLDEILDRLKAIDKAIEELKNAPKREKVGLNS